MGEWPVPAESLGVTAPAQQLSAAPELISSLPTGHLKFTKLLFFCCDSLLR